MFAGSTAGTAVIGGAVRATAFIARDLGGATHTAITPGGPWGATGLIAMAIIAKSTLR